MIVYIRSVGENETYVKVYGNTQIHKRQHISRKIIHLQQKLKAKHDPNSKFVFSCSHACDVIVSQIRQAAVICYLLSFTNNAALFICDLAIQSSVNVLRRKKAKNEYKEWQKISREMHRKMASMTDMEKH